MLALLAGCSAPAAVDQSDASTVSTASTGRVVDPDLAAVTSLINTINETAALPVAGQQRLLAAVVEPGFEAQQAACASATITIRIDPVLPDLRADPDWRPDPATTGVSTTGSDPPLAGTRYRVPVLIEVYTGSLRTGTDMTTLRLSVIDGVAHSLPLCLV